MDLRVVNNGWKVAMTTLGYHREVMELAMDVWGMESQILTGG